MKQFRAFVTTETKKNTFNYSIQEKNLADLPKSDLLIKVQYSSLNYKDALSATGNKGVTKKYPHTPGIDAVGIVEKSKNKNFPINSCVIVSGYDLGMNTPGGFSEYISVPSSWALIKPDLLTSQDSMTIGTAGLTAGLCIKAIEDKKSIKGINAIVSGATGGVGSISVALLSKLGANVTAVTGKKNSHQFLKNLGAQQVIDRNQFLKSVRRPIGKGLWDAAIDVAGGETLSSILCSLKYGGIATCCGLVDNPNFETSIFPFILRANQLVGIDSAEAGLSNKKKIWELFSNDWKLDNLDQLTHIVNLEELSYEIDKILSGNQNGRIVIKL
jgi:putative YhdH/YhfP family quinone oxidoreductase